MKTQPAGLAQRRGGRLGREITHQVRATTFAAQMARVIIGVPINSKIVRKKRHPMDARKLEHFKKLLLNDLQRHARNVGEEQARAIEILNDDAKESSDLALRDVIQELALSSGDRESRAIAE